MASRNSKETGPDKTVQVNSGIPNIDLSKNRDERNAQIQTTKELARVSMRMREYEKSGKGETETVASLEKTMATAMKAQESKNLAVRKQGVDALKMVRGELSKLTEDLGGQRDVFIKSYDKVIKEAERTNTNLEKLVSSSKKQAKPLTKGDILKNFLTPYISALHNNSSPIQRALINVGHDVVKLGVNLHKAHKNGGDAPDAKGMKLSNSPSTAGSSGSNHAQAPVDNGNDKDILQNEEMILERLDMLVGQGEHRGKVMETMSKFLQQVMVNTKPKSAPFADEHGDSHPVAPVNVKDDSPNNESMAALVKALDDLTKHLERGNHIIEAELVTIAKELEKQPEVKKVSKPHIKLKSAPVAIPTAVKVDTPSASMAPPVAKNALHTQIDADHAHFNDARNGMPSANTGVLPSQHGAPANQDIESRPHFKKLMPYPIDILPKQYGKPANEDGGAEKQLMRVNESLSKLVDIDEKSLDATKQAARDAQVSKLENIHRPHAGGDAPAASSAAPGKEGGTGVIALLFGAVEGIVGSLTKIFEGSKIMNFLKDSKFVGNITGFFKSFEGIGSVVGDVMKALGPVGDFLKVGAKVVKGIPFLGEIIGAIEGIFDGIFNAEKIMGRAVDFRDRIAVSIGGFFGSFTDIIDMIGNLFGVDTKIKGKTIGEWTRYLVAEGLSAIFHPLELFGKVFEMLKSGLQGLAKDYVKTMPDFLVPDGIKAFANGASDSGSAQPSQAKANPTGPIAGANADTKKATDKAADAAKSSTTVVAPVSTNINNGQTHNYPAKLTTKNDDTSIGWGMGMIPTTIM